MQCCICASAYRRFTTNLRKDEDKKYEKNLGCKRAEDRTVWRAFRHHIRLCGHVAVELADACSVWLAPDQLLAGVRNPRPQQDPVRRIPRPARRPYELAAPHAGAFRAHDSRGAGEVSSIHARPMQSL